MSHQDYAIDADNVNTEESKPSFYAVIPASVRYCKALTPNAKLLYGEITALCSREGYCWAGNKYFADLYEVDEKQIKRWIASLVEQGFIRTESKNIGFKKSRKIYISEENQNSFTKGQKCPYRKNNLKDDDENQEMSENESPRENPSTSNIADGGKNAPIDGGKNAPYSITYPITTSSDDDDRAGARIEKVVIRNSKGIETVVTKEEVHRSALAEGWSPEAVPTLWDKLCSVDVPITSWVRFLNTCWLNMKKSFETSNTKQFKSTQKSSSSPKVEVPKRQYPSDEEIAERQRKNAEIFRAAGLC